MSNVKHIKKSMEEYTCSSCGDTIPKGSPYRYFKPGFRGRMKVRRCMKPECTPRRSELTNNKMAAVYEAQEDAEREIRALKWDDEATWEEQIGAIEAAFSTASEAAEEVAGEYDEAIENMPSLEDRVGEFRDAARDWADELTSWQAPDEPEEEPDSSEGTEARQEWLADSQEKFDAAVEDALAILDNLSA